MKPEMLKKDAKEVAMVEKEENRMETRVSLTSHPSSSKSEVKVVKKPEVKAEKKKEVKKAKKK
jgi:hypothetical protein